MSTARKLVLHHDQVGGLEAKAAAAVVEDATAPTSGESAYRKALGMALHLAPPETRDAVAMLLQRALGVDASAGADALRVYAVGADLEELDAAIAAAGGKGATAAAAVDAWLATLGDSERMERLGRYLAALDAGQVAHTQEGQRLLELGRSERARRLLIRTRVEKYMATHQIPSVRAGDYTFRLISPKRADVELLVPVDELPPQFRGTETKWVPLEGELHTAIEHARELQAARLAQVDAWVAEEGATRAEAEAMFPPTPAEDVLRLAKVVERTGQHVRVTARGRSAEGDFS